MDERWDLGVVARTVRLHRRLRRLARSAPRRRVYPLVGAVFALGAPFGLLIAHSLAEGAAPTPSWIRGEVSARLVTYVYLTCSTVGALALLGYLLGRTADGLRALAMTDPLTGLSNRRLLTDRITDETRRAVRDRVPLAVIALDVDGLKRLNDRLGHRAGDAALLAVARAISGTTRATDTAARTGGDEFMVLLPQTTAAAAAALAQRLQEAVARSPGTQPLSVSIGIAGIDGTRPARGEDLADAADTLLYRAKARGGGVVVSSLQPERPAERLVEKNARSTVPARAGTDLARGGAS